MKRLYLLFFFFFLAGPGYAEVISYNIKQMGISAGKATLTFAGSTQKEGRSYVLIVFKADGFNFNDEERIYLDAQTLFRSLLKGI